MKLKNTRTVIEALTREIKRLRRRNEEVRHEWNEQCERTQKVREAFSRLAPKAYKQFREELSAAAAKTDRPASD